MSLRGTKELLHRKENEFDRSLLFLLAEGTADFDIMWKRKLLPTHSTQINACKCYVFVRRPANANLTQLDQNDLPRILLKFHLNFWPKKSFKLNKYLKMSNFPQNQILTDLSSTFLRQNCFHFTWKQIKKNVLKTFPSSNPVMWQLSIITQVNEHLSTSSMRAQWNFPPINVQFKVPPSVNCR